jgi:hypothetical protein
VSRLVRERGGYDLLPEQGCAPVNKYLPPRRTTATATRLERKVEGIEAALLRWVDKLLS